MKILMYPDKSLKENTEKVKSDISEKVIKNIRNLLLENNGIGLSANQVGINKRFFVTKDKVFINPKIVKRSGYKIEEEGCLSIPKYRIPVKRSTKITVEYYNEKNEFIEEKFRGLYARAIQHEIDHLDGYTILDKGQNKHQCKFYKKVLEKNKND